MPNALVTASARRDSSDTLVLPPSSQMLFDAYLAHIIHDWSRVVAMLGFCLVPVFGLLDSFIVPPGLLDEFLMYRGGATAVILAQYVVIRNTPPGRWSLLHGYFFSIVTGGMITQMTRDLGGFDSAYYAGLNLVMVAVNIFLPWSAIHSAVNGLILISMYVVVNGLWGGPFTPALLVNNLYFLSGTLVIAVAINRSRHKLIAKEFRLRAELQETNHELDASRRDLQAARDALWGEMEVAKHIQTALLPRNTRLGPFEVAGVMHPASEVGGDLYDILETPAGQRWVAIGDVSGHGVESGLVMMMTQNCIAALVQDGRARPPSDVFVSANAILRENLRRLRTNLYVTLSIMRLDADGLWMAGKHQDLLILRARTGAVEAVPTRGCWLGVVEDPRPAVTDQFVPWEPGDVVLLHTDGISEAQRGGELYGDDRLAAALKEHGNRPPDETLRCMLDEINEFQPHQDDDRTLVLVRYLASG
ncbi:MAG: SpoIIE family protein phosphatase [Deltaproteobacteria bacterium]|nr:SpoIIE family protein phosphatase [Deltaproteobacteria bacterium]